MSELLHEARFTVALPLPSATAWPLLERDIDAWWPAMYRAVASPSRMRFSATLGGRLEELGANGEGVLWYVVQAVTPGQSITLAGHIAPPFGGPALSLLRLTLSDQPDGSSCLEIHDSIMGRIDPAMVESGWRDIFAGFAAHLAALPGGAG
ncbi:MAG: hypothetical protein SF172_16995 [Burkholderiales bacterium]|nr:hypothetical protein [Burkholderiales bacterium]